MLVRKAVITAAAPDQHTLPLQQLVDREGRNRTALQLIIEEVIGAGIEEICLVIRPGDQRAYVQSAGAQEGMLTFVEQQEPRGYGDAIARARDFVAAEPFLHLVGDHLYLSATDRRCARQLIEVAQEHDCAVSAVQATRENKLPDFGAIGGTHVPRQPHLYEVTAVLEKPTPTQAEQELIIAGLRSGYYQCFFGMHVLTPLVMEILAELLAEAGRRVTLSDALQRLAPRQKYLAYEVQGARYNIGAKYGLLMAQLALSLSGSDRDQILTELVELLASSRSGIR
ncbi:MAG: NTP transferase domain-containing protein [Planctomycetaceae bacterium]|nr:NTP transferase domain-containing protein [Planctomycetaceae bacterium]